MIDAPECPRSGFVPFLQISNNEHKHRLEKPHLDGRAWETQLTMVSNSNLSSAANTTAPLARRARAHNHCLEVRVFYSSEEASFSHRAFPERSTKSVIFAALPGVGLKLSL